MSRSCSSTEGQRWEEEEEPDSNAGPAASVSVDEAPSQAPIMVPAIRVAVAFRLSPSNLTEPLPHQGTFIRNTQLRMFPLF